MSALGLDALIISRADAALVFAADSMAVVRFLRWLDEEVAAGRCDCFDVRKPG